jgi:TonB family protein
MDINTKGLTALILALVINLPSQAAQKDAFKQVYQAYQQAIEQENKNDIKNYARQSYELGCRHYGENTLNCAALTVNYALALNHAGAETQELKDAEKFLLAANKIYKKHLGKKSLEVADTYLQLASLKNFTNSSRAQKKSYLKYAIDIGRSLAKEQPLGGAKIMFEAGVSLLKLGLNESKILILANEIFSQHLEENDTRLIESRFWLAKYYQAKRKYSKSISPLETNIKVLSQFETSHPYELVSRAFLVKSYEELGKSELATKHCQAIGRLTPWKEDQEQVPLYRKQPEYPMSAARRGKNGAVKLAYTINESGFVEDITVLESSDQVFNKVSIKALKQWRFAPKFESGKAVKARSTVQLDYKLAKS